MLRVNSAMELKVSSASFSPLHVSVRETMRGIRRPLLVSFSDEIDNALSWTIEMMWCTSLLQISFEQGGRIQGTQVTCCRDIWPTKKECALSSFSIIDYLAIGVLGPSLPFI